MEGSIENKGMVIRTTERCNKDHHLFARSRMLLRNASFFPSFSHGVWRIQAGGLFLLTVFSFFPALFHVEEILFFILLGLALLAGWLEGKNLRIRTPIDLPLLLLLAWILLTIPFSLNPEYSFVEWRKLVAQCLVFYWAVYVIREISQGQQQEGSRLPFAWLEGIRGKAYLPNVFLGVLIGTVLLSAFALVDFIDRGGNWQDRNIRAMAPGSDYNWLSTYLVLAMPIVVYCGIAFRGLWGKIFSVGIFALALLAQAASYTRAGWLASAVQLFSWGLITRRRVLLISFILGIILVLVATMGIGQMGYQGDTLHIWTLETRIQVWKLGMDKIVSHPIVGIGYGNNNFQPALVDSPMGDQPMHLHNTLLMMGVGSGIPGLVLFSWVFVRLGLELFPKKNRQNLADSETLKLCLGIVLVGFFCRNLFDYMFAGSLAYLFWLLMACGLESSMKSRQQTEPYHPH
jgi:heptosyltransferase-3/putative inorganic carbon (HCO3(-)) transporter